MPESRDYYRGAIAALDKCLAEGFNKQARDFYRSQLAALPPDEPQPDAWGLVEELETMLRNMTGNLAGVNMPYKGNERLSGDAGQFYEAYNAGIDSAHEFSVRLANKALARIAAAIKERGA